MSESYHVRIEKDYLVFSAGHFITFDGDVCERLHGHNYRLAAEVHGPLDENHYVVDFIALRDTLKAIVDELDHHMLLPTEHPLIQIAADDQSVEVTFRDRRWVFPRGDCVLLPVANTTTELLARYIGLRLLDDLKERTGQVPDHVKIAVDENFGQWGVWEQKK
ncbi:MAG: 6-pyruvoyl tetrahydropterin synthase family protein [Planctomycetota bacterium]|nr:6-pyruvoyl tetrahydropterin synthase family protein [Planctomycetota bacterium]